MNNYGQSTKIGVKGVTALYSRLSREDSLDGQSLSIQNQQQILEDYAVKQGFGNIRHFHDDGISGTTFDRTGWNKLVAEVEAGNVAIVAVKDMSRLGRDHVQVGLYMETFRKLGVRFIAIGNGIDSINPESLEFAPFINIMSEWYARDTSRKIKAVAHSRGNAGKPLSYNAIYGYKKSPDDKHLWLVDEEAATIVRRIFQMVVDGICVKQIARTLTEEKVERPSYYFAMNRMVGLKPSARDLSDPYTWRESTITALLSKPEYCGHTVNFRTYKESYKDKYGKRNPQEKWKIFYNTHEAIIEQDIFDTVQRLRGTPRRTDSIGEANPLTGIVFCGDCEAKMYNSRQRKEYVETRYGKTYKHKISDHYSCSAYTLGKGAFKIVCSSHYIRTVVIRELVLDAIRQISEYVKLNEMEFVEKIREETAVKQEETAKAHKKQLVKNERRIAELDNLFRKVYEDNATGKLSDERFKQLSTGYEVEQAGLKQQNITLQTELTAFVEDGQKADRFIDIVKRYTAFEELTTQMLNSFVAKIIVHEADKSSGERVQQVDIYFNFIGNFNIPKEEAPPLTHEELEEQEKLRQKRAKQREANQRCYAKKKRKFELQRAVEAGEISVEQLETIDRERQAQEELRCNERNAERQEYKRQWAANKRRQEREAKKKADGSASTIAV